MTHSSGHADAGFVRSSRSCWDSAGKLFLRAADTSLSRPRCYWLSILVVIFPR